GSSDAATRIVRAHFKKSDQRETTVTRESGDGLSCPAIESGTERDLSNKHEASAGSTALTFSACPYIATSAAPARISAREQSSIPAPHTGNPVASLISAIRMLRNSSSGSMTKK